MKNCVVYARVSTKDQADTGTSLETQTLLCRKYALEQGYTIVREIAEDASGARLDRPGMDEVRELARAGAISAVVFYHLDRLSRDDTNTLILARELTKQDVRLDCATMRIEDSPTGKFLFSVLAAQAALERAMIIERTQRGKRRAAELGRVMATPYTAYGYRYVVGEARLEVCEPEADWVRVMFSWVAYEGASVHEVMRRLNAAGVPTRKAGIAGHEGARWSRLMVRHILRSPVYRGEYLYNKREKGRKRARADWVSVPVPAIVSAQVWHDAQAVMDRAALYHSPRNVKHDYLLRGLLYCSVCGYRLYGRVVAVHRYYGCDTHNQPSRARPESCGVRLVRADRAEPLVWQEVVRQLVDERLVRDWLSTRRDEREGQQYEDRLHILRGRASRLQEEADRLLDVYQTGEIDRATFSARMEAIKRRREALQGEQAGVDAEYIAWQRDRLPALDWREMTARLREMLPAASWDQRRDFLTSLDLRLVWGVDRSLTVYGLLQVVVLRL